MKKIITVGNGTQDIFILYEEEETLRLQSKKSTRSFLLLEAGIKTDVQKLQYATGGGATNAAVSFKRLGIHAFPCFKVGTGKVGEFIIDRLQQEGLDLSYAITSPQADSPLSFIIPTPEKNYTALCYRGSHTELSLEDIPFSIVPACDYLYITALNKSSAELLPKIAQQAKADGVKVATNPSTKQITASSAALYEALKHIDILILNAHESRLLFQTILRQEPWTKPLAVKRKTEEPSLLQAFMPYINDQLTLYDYFHKILAHGPSYVVVTNGAEGVYIATGQKVYFQPSIPTQPITAVGAGDAFGSTFVGNLTLGKSLEQAIVYGVVNASSVISYLDAKTGLLTLPELEARAQKVGLKQLQEFSFL